MAKKASRRQLSWDAWYALASAYREAHGDLLVPRDYVSPGGQKLGRWIERQRAKYNGVPSVRGQLDATQIALLNRIDMAWKLESRHPWADWLRELDRYRARFGDLDIPCDFEHGDYHLGNWIKEQRKNRLAGLLTEGEIADLDARGMLWSAKTRPRSWEDWYRDAEAYYRKNGNLMVPLDYRTEAGHRLGIWISGQRETFLGRRQARPLTPDQVERLDAIHMVWRPASAQLEAWDQMYLWVAQYLDQNGRLPLWPRDLRAPDGRSMWGWIRTQRTQLAQGRVAPARADKLAMIGIRPAARKAAVQP